jgi:hypothetical protein
VAAPQKWRVFCSCSFQLRTLQPTRHLFPSSKERTANARPTNDRQSLVRLTMVMANASYYTHFRIVNLAHIVQMERTCLL